MIEVRTAQPEEFASILDMLNVTFFSDDTPEEKRDFLRLLPKLYKKEYAPWQSNYCVFEDGQPVAAVGMYVSELCFNTRGGFTSTPTQHRLKLGGIGNVGVAPNYRGKGYMKLAMNAAMQAMREQGCHLGELSGDRHRYRHYGFEHGGVHVKAEFSIINVNHSYGKGELAANWVAKPIQPEDIAQVQALIEAEPLHIKHDSAALHDILSSWREQPWAIWYGDKLAGRFNLSWDNKQVLQLQLAPWVDSLEQPLRALFALLPDEANITVNIPLWRNDLLALAKPVAENRGVFHSGQYYVLNWEKTLQALLNLQAQCKPLLDGELTVKIAGYAGDETLRIAVQNGLVSVTAHIGEPEKIMSHFDATSYFLHLVCPERTCAVAQQWFPLPMYLWSFDTV
ncbi:MAG: GNAT family N-acetyltransferase [Oscillospiraceae bacterium]|nr:GNAT family N-acetyltransferase [Oscillospiraceae bacterium]